MNKDAKALFHDIYEESLKVIEQQGSREAALGLCESSTTVCIWPEVNILM